MVACLCEFYIKGKGMLCVYIKDDCVCMVCRISFFYFQNIDAAHSIQRTGGIKMLTPIQKKPVDILCIRETVYTMQAHLL